MKKSPHPLIVIDRYPRKARHLTVAGFAAGVMLTAFVLPNLSLVLAALMVVLLIFRDRLILDPENRTYRVDQGFYKRTRSFAHLKCIEVERRQYRDSEGAVEKVSFTVRLLSVDVRETPWGLGEAANLEEALANATVAAQGLSLPLVEGPSLTQLRSELEAPHPRV